MTSTLAELLTFYVNRGIALLDKKNPEWMSSIGFSALDISDPYNCILGQLYDDYILGRNELELTHENAILHGFIGEPMDFYDELVSTVDVEYILTQIWKGTIAERQHHALYSDV